MSKRYHLPLYYFSEVTVSDRRNIHIIGNMLPPRACLRVTCKIYRAFCINCAHYANPNNENLFVNPVIACAYRSPNDVIVILWRFQKALMNSFIWNVLSLNSWCMLNRFYTTSDPDYHIILPYEIIQLISSEMRRIGVPLSSDESAIVHCQFNISRKWITCLGFSLQAAEK